MQIKITSAGLWSRNESDSNGIDVIDVPAVETESDKLEAENVDEAGFMFLTAKFWLNWFGSNARKGKLEWKFWRTDVELVEHPPENSVGRQNSKATSEDAISKVDKEPYNSFPLLAKETKAAIMHFGKRWYRHLSFVWKSAMQAFGSV